jgi:hypothetical protein
MWPFLVAIVAILSSALVKISRDRAQTDAAQGRQLRDVLDRLDAVEADRDRLRTRVEALEAIVTDEDYDLDREARALLGRTGAPPVEAPRLPLDPEDPDPLDDAPAPRSRTR